MTHLTYGRRFGVAHRTGGLEIAISENGASDQVAHRTGGLEINIKAGAIFWCVAHRTGGLERT